MWFGIELFFEGRNQTNPQEESLWEQRVLLLDAASEFVARVESERIGRESEHEYIAVNGGRIKWEFYAVGGLHKIDADTIANKTEVFSRFLRPKDVKSILTPFD